ncbi:MAG: alcohol dehydrogenase catalytic domain-containing protein [Phycisphaerales bacterium]|nr:MAG: alcohol dehydrogenase catalytic domain-containing protein [Phycisphaerales bacterium]
MKAALLTSLRHMEFTDLPDPQIQNNDEVLLKIEAVGVCGSDVHYYETGRIGSQIIEYPFIIGHECSATVEAVGSSVTRVKVGDLVVVDPAISCHQCDQCRKGRENTCNNVLFLGSPGLGGCLCEYMVMPEECCYPTGGAITWEQAALCEPLSIGAYTAKRAELAKGAKVAILGTGPIGLSVLLATQVEKAGRIYVTDKIEARLRAALGAGADWAANPDNTDIVSDILDAEPFGLDVVFECCGQQEALDQSFDLLGAGGLLVMVGTARQDTVSFNVDKFRRKELSIKYIRRQNHCVQTAMDLIASGRADPDFMITHHFPLERTVEAFDLVAEYGDGVIKAMINV